MNFRMPSQIRSLGMSSLLVLLALACAQAWATDYPPTIPPTYGPGSPDSPGSYPDSPGSYPDSPGSYPDSPGSYNPGTYPPTPDSPAAYPPTYGPGSYAPPGSYPGTDLPGAYYPGAYPPTPDSPGTLGPVTSDGYSNMCYNVSGLDLASQFGLGGCDGLLPARLCLGDTYFTSGDYIYQLWFRMTDGSKRAFSQTNHGTYMGVTHSFIATSDVGYNRNTGQMNCRIMSQNDIVLDLQSTPPSITVVESCNYDGDVIQQVLRHTFAPPPFAFPYCTPSLIANFVDDAPTVAALIESAPPPPPPPASGCYELNPASFAASLDLEPCNGQLPAQLCLGSAYYTPGDSIYQLWFLMQNGTKLAVSKTNHGTFLHQSHSFIATSNLLIDPATGLMTCRIMEASDITLNFAGSPPTMSIVETCEYQGTVVKRAVVHTFAPPPFSFPYCAPQLVADVGSGGAGRKLLAAAEVRSMSLVAVGAAGLAATAMVVAGMATLRQRRVPLQRTFAF